MFDLLVWNYQLNSDSYQLFTQFLQLKAAEIGNDALKAVHGSDYTVGCTPCLLCKYLYFYHYSFREHSHTYDVRFLGT